MLNNVIAFQKSHTGSHFMLLCTIPNTHAHIKNVISKLFIFAFDDINKHPIGSNVHNMADIKTRRFWLEASIQK